MLSLFFGKLIFLITCPLIEAFLITNPPSGHVRGECYTCNGIHIYICEQFSTPTHCAEDKPYCINDLINNKDGSRTLDKRCASKTECVQSWNGTSDRPECTGYDPSRYIADAFSCSFCCTTPLCNQNIVPRDLYTP
uniref:Uncharacterized protein LOC111126372 n=1 Tax=Crassostrea virginica TaxID=6565 RepID=A0A8B8DG19_CRAVI|nr:uncharacterized protein LOC111126372 [Crassostrea virginica]